MRGGPTIPLALAALVAAGACQADRETFEETDATLEPAEEIREAPLTTGGRGESLQGELGTGTVSGDTLEEVDYRAERMIRGDTAAVADSIR